MAKKEGEKSKKGILIAILVPILAILLIASMLFAVFDWIIESIENVITKIVDFFNNPLGSIKEVWAKFTNWINGFLRAVILLMKMNMNLEDKIQC